MININLNDLSLKSILFPIVHRMIETNIISERERIIPETIDLLIICH